MHILLSAYSCAPEAGSEAGKGWRYAHSFARLGHDVTVLASGVLQRVAVERWLSLGNELPAGIRIVWHDPMEGAEPVRPEAIGNRRHYLRWQRTVPEIARRLHAERPFDVTHHVNWAALRWPTHLGGIAPRTVVGPVGGGASAPWRLCRGMSASALRHEVLRDAANLWGLIDPWLARALSRVDAILVSDPETMARVPRAFRDRSQLWPEIFTSNEIGRHPRVQQAAGPLRLLAASRLEYWKGVQFALGALRLCLDAGLDVTLDIAGTGPHEQEMHAIAARLGLDGAIRFLGLLPHPAMPGLMAEHDVFLSPSLHDTGPLVIGEALHQGLPVICLDIGGAARVVDASRGVVVATPGVGVGEIERRIADGIQRYAQSADRLASHRAAAYAQADAMTLDQRLSVMVERVFRGGKAVDLGYDLSISGAMRASGVG